MAGLYSVLALLLLAAPASGAGEPGTPDSAVTRVEVVIGLDASLSLDVLAPTLRGHLVDLPLALELEPLAAASTAERLAWAREHAAALVVWIERREQGVRIAVLRRDDDRMFVRDLDIADDPAGHEALGAVLRTLLEAPDEAVGSMQWLVPEPDAAASEPSEPGEPATTSTGEPATATRARERVVWLMVGHQGRSFARERPWQPGLDVELGLGQAHGVVGSLRVGVLPRGRIDAQGVSLALTRVPIELGLAYRRPLHARVALLVGARGTLELLDWTTRATTGVTARDGLAVRAGASAWLGLPIRLWRGLSLALDLGLGGWLANVELQAATAEGVVTITRPSAFDARASLGLGWIW